jgi:hypothetical protein
MILILVSIDIIFEIDLNIVVHLIIDVLTQETTDDCYATKA